MRKNKPILVIIVMCVLLGTALPADAQKHNDYVLLSELNGQNGPTSKILDKKISIELENVTVDNALKTVAEENELNLAYSRDYIPVKKTVSIVAENVAVTEVLQRILDDTGMEIVVSEAGTFVLIPSEQVQRVKGAQFTGRITDQNGETLIGANVYVRAAEFGGRDDIGASTNMEGVYTFLIPARYIKGQEVKLHASYIGYKEEIRKIVLKQGEITQDFVLQSDVFGLDEVVVTGVVESTPKKKLTFTVGRLFGEDMELVPPPSSTTLIQGKIAGAQVVTQDGLPGRDASILLRGATSLTQSNQPLLIVDGVILASNLSDIDANQIESVEVIKGAAAASLYGSRAAAGVLNIKTKRGASLGTDQTKIVIRNEYGFNKLYKDYPIALHHPWKKNANGEFIDANGNVVDESKRIMDAEVNGLAFADNEWGGPLYDHMELFNPGSEYTNLISLSHKSLNTNYLISLTNFQQGGIVDALEGYNRKSARLNFDHSMNDNIQLSASNYYSTSHRDTPVGDKNPFRAFIKTPAWVDLTEPNDDGTPYNLHGDTFLEQDNPLYTLNYSEQDNYRDRVMMSGRIRYTPINWFNLEADISFDRSNRQNTEYYPKGYKTLNEQSLNLGYYRVDNSFDQAINSSITASFNRDFGDLITHTKLRYLYESQESNDTYTSGYDLAVSDVHDLDIIQGEKSVGSAMNEIRSIGYYYITGMEYQDRYLADFLVRRDGSSLFGSDERWHTYYRVSGAYRISEEPWFDVPAIDELKLRISRGTAGGRPSFSAQYETFSVGSGTISKAQLGNKKLKPEHATENEFGLNMTLLNRFNIELTYAKTVTEDQLLNVPLAGIYGYSSQWQNAGTLESNTYEGTLDFNIMNREGFRWSSRIVFDRTRQKITEFDLPPYKTGGRSAFYLRNGEVFGAMYGQKWMTSTDQLPEGADPSCFQLNDDGLLVAVGSGNSYSEGISKQLWGTTVATGDAEYKWGMPLQYVDADGNNYHKIGDVVPDFKFALSNTFQWKGFVAYLLFDATVGGDIYNSTKQLSYRNGNHADYDQFNKADGNKKPYDYYVELFEGNTVNSWFVESGTYVKLRELSFGYTVTKDQLSRFLGPLGITQMDHVNLNVVGRNLYTWTDYSGWDPEVGEGTVTRIDYQYYPQYRTFKFVVELGF